MSKLITITCDHDDVADKQITQEHADRLFAMSNNGGWRIKEDGRRTDNNKGEASEEKAGKSHKARDTSNTSHEKGD